MALTDKLTAIGNAIRAKTGGSSLLTLDEMPPAIASIPTGGSPVINHLTITANGTYTAPSGIDGYSPITVNVSSPQSSVLWRDGTWAEISAVLSDYYAGNISDLSQYFKVGDTRIIHVNAIAADSTTGAQAMSAVDKEVVIIGIEHDDLTTPINGKTKAAITVECLHPLERTIKMFGNYNSQSYTYYSNSYVKKYLTNHFIPALPSECQNLIKSVTKLYNRYVSNSDTDNIMTINETCWILSASEIDGTVMNVESDGVMYEYFIPVINRIKIKQNNTAPAVDHWLRTSIYTTSGSAKYANYSNLAGDASDSSIAANSSSMYVVPNWCM